MGGKQQPSYLDDEDVNQLPSIYDKTNEF